MLSKVLNKADSMDPSDLLKVNSALTWSLARILRRRDSRRALVFELEGLFERQSIGFDRSLSEILPRTSEEDQGPWTEGVALVGAIQGDDSDAVALFVEKVRPLQAVSCEIRSSMSCTTWGPWVSWRK